jgi:hypothetical protein
MIPNPISVSGLWDVLPPGIHDATMEEVERRFATNDRRRKLFEGFRAGVETLRQAGCRIVFLDGSYVTEKEAPGDYDACWEPAGVDDSKLDPVLLDFTNKRRNQKLKYGGEFFPSSAKADGKQTFVEFFQTDRYSGNPKGIVRISLV